MKSAPRVPVLSLNLFHLQEGVSQNCDEDYAVLLLQEVQYNFGLALYLVPCKMVASGFPKMEGDGLSQFDFDKVKRVTAVGRFDELLVVTTLGVFYSVESKGRTIASLDADFCRKTGVVGFALGCDVICLLQEVVVRPTNGAVRSCEDGGLVETEGGYGEVFVDVGDVVHVLVPDRACGRPVAWAAKDVEAAVAHLFCRVE